MKNRIRITGPGIFGARVTDDNVRGEYPVGHEFDTDADLPAGWAGKAEIIGKGTGEGSTFLTGSLPSLAGKNKAELLEIAEAESVQIEDGATNDDIKSAIELAREAKQ